MTKICKQSIRALAIAAAALLTFSSFNSTVVAATLVPPSAEPAVAAVADASDDYLEQLLRGINARRAQAGSPPVVFVTAAANQAVGDYLADLTPQMVSLHACFHGQHNPVAPGWDYVAASGLDGEALGEVLACPDDSGYWTPDRIADSWWGSPTHFETLYADAAVNAMACGTYGPQRGGRAFQTIACVTYRI